jgi:hypothetical protein
VGQQVLKNAWGRLYFWCRAGLLFDIAVGVELFEVGPKVVDLLIVLDAGENHFRARDFSLGILDVFLECRLIPTMPEFLLASEYW